MRLTPPRIVTFVVSLVLAILAVASSRVHIPTVGPLIAGHRMEVLIGAYVLLALGVVLRGI